MKQIIFFGFLLLSFGCGLARYSNEVLKRNKIFIEAHRGVTEGQKNHNTKEAILNAIDKGVESFETDAWLTSDKKVVLLHDLDSGIYYCKNNIYSKLNKLSQVCELSWSELQECETKEGKYKIPLLEDIMAVTKGKIFMNLEIKDTNEEIWEKIKELIEKYEYYDQISICSFHSEYLQNVDQYNKEFNRTIVFGFLNWDILNINKVKIYNINSPNHQLSLNAQFIKNNPDIIKQAHDNGMTVAAWFFQEPQQYYDFFEMGVDVIVTDYPIKAVDQLKKYKSDENYLEGCLTTEKNSDNLLSCKSCENGYELVNIVEEGRTLCKLKYEIDYPDLYRKNSSGVYQEKNIFAIKMLMSPIENPQICKKNGKTIFYFEWLFDLYGYDPNIRKFIISTGSRYSSYSHLTEKHIKKLNFSQIEMSIEGQTINQNDFICKDLYDVNYFTYRVMAAHCYFIYNGEEKSSYTAQFKLFDSNYVSYVTYDNKRLDNKDSWGPSEGIYFYSSSSNSSFCSNMKDPFQVRASCTNKINNCMDCQNENTCIKCNYGFSLFNGQCQSSTNYKNNKKYYTPDNEINYYPCSSMVKGCEECSYDALSFNKFHCTKCSSGYNLNEGYECKDGNGQTPQDDPKNDDDIKPIAISSGKYIDSLISFSFALLLIILI